MIDQRLRLPRHESAADVLRDGARAVSVRRQMHGGAGTLAAIPPRDDEELLSVQQL